MASTAVEVPTTALDPEDYPDGTIAISGGEFLRYGGFVHALMTTLRPSHSRLNLMQSISIVDNMNTNVNEMTGDWCWIVADDQVWLEDCLLVQLDAMYREDLDIVVPLILRRSPPFVPVAFCDYDPAKGYLPWSLRDLPEHGCVECVAAGSGGMLIRKRVFQGIAEWQGHGDIFEYEAGTQLREDIHFTEKAAKCGFKVHLCVDALMGHRGGFTIRPHYSEGRFAIAFDMGVNADGRHSTILVEGDAGPSSDR